MAEHISGPLGVAGEPVRYRVVTSPGLARTIEIRTSKLLAAFLAAMLPEHLERYYDERARWLVGAIPDLDRFFLKAGPKDPEAADPNREMTYSQGLETAVLDKLLPVEEARRIAATDPKLQQVFKAFAKTWL